MKPTKPLPTLASDGYEMHRSVIPEELFKQYRDEADRVANASRASCVRHLRQQSPLFDDLAQSPRLTQLLPAGLIPVRSILFDKTPDQNWSVAWHQDVTIALRTKNEAPGYHPWSVKDGYPHVQPPMELLDHMITIRLHLDDTPSTNGALRVIPSSHLLGKLSSDQIAEHIEDEPVVCDCSAGDVLLMKPLILHSSRRSELAHRRRVIHFEYARNQDLHPSLQWAE